jgi:hypothetical protein
MSRLPVVFASVAVGLAATAATATPRAFVASYGNDANTVTNCGPTTPCRTFATAMTVADDGGQIIVLDSAGYGALTIAKSISVVAPDGIYAGLTVASGGTVVTIATAGIDVVLKGLTITGQGAGYGIQMTDGSSLHVERTTIAKFSSGTGLRVQTPAKVNVIDSVIRDNATGIVIGAGATVGVIDSKVLSNSSIGMAVFTPGAASGVTTTLSIGNSTVSGSQYCVDNSEVPANIGVVNATRATVADCQYGFINEPLGAGRMTVTESAASNCSYGFLAAGSGTEARTLTVSASSASNNTYGFYQASGTFVSLGNNAVYGNSTANTTGTISASPLQ